MKPEKNTSFYFLLWFVGIYEYFYSYVIKNTESIRYSNKKNK